MFQSEDPIRSEVHHRVRNNLQIISSLLDLEVAFSLSPLAAEVIHTVSSRINSIALLNDQFFWSDESAIVDAAPYLERVVQATRDTVAIKRDRIRLEISVQSLFIPTAHILPLGLIVNELTVNALKHARTDSEMFVLSLNGKNRNTGYDLVLSDNGKALHECPEPTCSQLGIRLVNGLARQIGAEVQFDFSDGICCQIRLPHSKNKRKSKKI